MKKILLLILTINLFAVDIHSLFENEIKNSSIGLNFKILEKSYVDLNPIGGFADGRYRLSNYKISQLEDNIYKLDMLFVKKKRFFSYTQNMTIYFWHKDRVVVFATPKRKVKIILNTQKTKVTKYKNGYEIEKVPSVKIVKLPVNGGVVYLYIESLF